MARNVKNKIIEPRPTGLVGSRTLQVQVPVPKDNKKKTLQAVLTVETNNFYTRVEVGETTHFWSRDGRYAGDGPAGATDPSHVTPPPPSK